MDRKLVDLYIVLTIARDEYESACDLLHYEQNRSITPSSDYLHHLEGEVAEKAAAVTAAQQVFIKYAAATLTCSPDEYEKLAIEQIETYLLSMGITDG